MRLYVLELKRLLKTRSVSFLLIAALVLSAVMAYVPVTYIQAYKTDKSGNIEAVSGREAIKVKRADKKALQGEMTEAKIRETITDIKEVWLTEPAGYSSGSICAKSISAFRYHSSAGTDSRSGRKESLYHEIFGYQ